MARLDKDRETEFSPKRMNYARDQIIACGFPITYEDETRLEFLFKGNIIKMYPYSGWHTGKGIKDGRGIAVLIAQLRMEGSQQK